MPPRRLATVASVVATVLLISFAGLSAQETPAYEGFGAVTRGALSSPTGYSTFHVTSLADSGTGTLRDAVSQGNRYIVFDVGGVIRLASDLNVYASYITIDGSTAPSPGITIQQPGDFGTNIYARSGGRSVHDVVVHNMRVDGLSPGVATGTGDIWGMDGEEGEVYNIVLDHITGVASRDGVFDIYGRVYNVTISWNLIKDTLVALHLSRETEIKERISIHHNVFAKNNERQIRLKDDSRADYVNNVVYGWGWFESGGRGLNIDTTYSVDPTINVVNNLFHHVNTPYGSAGNAIAYSGGVGTAKVYMSGNIVPSAETDTASTSGPYAVPASAQVTTYPAATLGNTVVPCAGTKYPTAAEASLLREISLAVGGSGGTCGTSTTPPAPAAPTNLRIVR
jgi:pectate lyase